MRHDEADEAQQTGNADSAGSQPRYRLIIKQVLNNK